MTPRLLLLHGFLSGSAAFDGLRDALGNDAATIAPDLPGYGDAPGPRDPRDYTLQLLADAMEPVLDREQPTHVLGHSMGGIVALELARRHPEAFARAGIAGLPIYGSREDALRHLHRRGILYRLALRSHRGSHAACAAMRRTGWGWGVLPPLVGRGQPRAHIEAAVKHSHAAHAGALDGVVFAGLVPDLAQQVGAAVELFHGDCDPSAPVLRVEMLAVTMGWPLTVHRGGRHQVVITQPEAAVGWVRERLLD
ncbi:MAG: alpha/beta fold hydrolase [Dehalococcoidia bacterium]